jgi:carbohydrate diacid regulator
MPNASACFVEIARTVTNRVAQLLDAPVVVTDDQGMIITSSEGNQAQLPGQWEDSADSVVNFLRLPLRHRTESGEIIIGEPCSQESVSPRLVQVLVELVINQTANSQYLNLNQHELKNQLIYDLLHGRVRDEIVALNRARQLGMDLTPPRAVILINAADYVLGQPEAGHPLLEADQYRRTRIIIRSIVDFFHLPNDTICADLGKGEVCVLKASDTKNLDIWANGEDNSRGSGSSWANLVALKRAADALLMYLRHETGACTDIGIGRYHPGISGLARSYEDARAALSLGTRFQGHNRVHCLGELGMAAFVGVSDESTKVDLAKYLLSPLDHEPELLGTLNCFFSENCCPSSTAKQLSIHRNTLSYRLDKIASLTGLEPRKFDDAVQMRLCLLLRSLQYPNVDE